MKVGDTVFIVRGWDDPGKSQVIAKRKVSRIDGNIVTLDEPVLEGMTEGDMLILEGAHV